MSEVSELTAAQQVAVLRSVADLLASSTQSEPTLAHTIAACLPALGDFGFFGPGHGSTFHVQLPRIAAPGGDRGATARGRGDDGAARSTASRRAGTGHVLLVDDNEDAAELLAELLRLSGYDVDVETSAPAALERAAKSPPDIALLDIGLPDIDGYELARRLRAQHGNERLRLVAVTGYGRDSDRERARTAGFDAHLTKPVEPAQLLETLARLLAR